jgi:hypothetical protein
MEAIRTQWNHTTKPSRFVVYKGDIVIFEGTYREGIQIFRDALNGQQEQNSLAKESEPHKTQHI